MSRWTAIAAALIVVSFAGPARADFWSDLRESVGLAEKQAETGRAETEETESEGAGADRKPGPQGTGKGDGRDDAGRKSRPPGKSGPGKRGGKGKK